jgi:hypothetical protein
MHVFGQGAPCVTEEVFAYIKKYEHDVKIVTVLKYVHINEEEQRAKNARVNAKQQSVICRRQGNIKVIVLRVMYFYKIINNNI